MFGADHLIEHGAFKEDGARAVMAQLLMGVYSRLTSPRCSHTCHMAAGSRANAAAEQPQREDEGVGTHLPRPLQQCAQPRLLCLALVRRGT